MLSHPLCDREESIVNIKSFVIGLVVGIVLTFSVLFFVGYRYQIVLLQGNILKHDTWTDNVLVYAGDGWIKLESKIKEPQPRLTSPAGPSAPAPAPGAPVPGSR